jgi:hypothetical protein
MRTGIHNYGPDQLKVLQQVFDSICRGMVASGNTALVAAGLAILR